MRSLQVTIRSLGVTLGCLGHMEATLGQLTLLKGYSGVTFNSHDVTWGTGKSILVLLGPTLSYLGLLTGTWGYLGVPGVSCGI